jgi:hypothetical protein
MENFEYWVVITLLIGIIAVQSISHRQERKDLYNRIMAKDLQEYKFNVTGRHVPNGIRKNTSDEMKRRNSPE